MARLNICTWIWGDKYGPEYIRRLADGVRRNLKQDYTWWVVTPGDEDVSLISRPGCFARLRMFDLEWQAAHGFETGDRLVCLDLDLIVTGGLDPLFDRPEPFGILQGVNAANPCPYNGSVWWTTAGDRSDVWGDFSLDAAERVAHFSFPDDQAWLAHKLPGAAAIGPKDGVYAFQKPGWPAGTDLPADARLVAFPGWRDPSRFADLPWIKEHWRA